MEGSDTNYEVNKPNTFGVAASGAGLGFLSGLTGVGGGIFLSPLLIFLRWGEIKQISGVAAAFILVNSAAGLLGFLTTKTSQLPPALPLWAVAAGIGGYLGAEYGSRRFGNPVIKRILSIILFLAGTKMIVGAFL